MSTLYIATADGGRAPYEEGQVRDMLRRGLLAPQTLYWKEGMAEWRPLAELFPSAISVGGPPPPPIQLARTLEPWATLTQVGLVLSLIVALLTSVCALAITVLALQQNFVSLRFFMRSLVVLTRINLTAWGLLLISFLVWVYRINLNARQFVGGLKSSPGFAVGAYFIPILNLFAPYQAMQEVWKASTDPVNWRAAKGSLLVGFWWTFWLLVVAISLGFVCIAHFKPAKGAALSEYTTWFVEYSVAVLVLQFVKSVKDILMIALIYLITQKQKKLALPSK